MEKPDPQALEATLRHFQKLAKENRFAENATFPHNTAWCLVCHPEQAGGDPFQLYVNIVAHCIPMRRPRLHADLIAAIREDLLWAGQNVPVTLEDLRSRKATALQAFRLWVRNALETGLELLSVHSSTSLSFSLEDAQGIPEREAFVEACIDGVMDHILTGKSP